ncbi:MAG: DedA family protein [Candidatus Altiarchaeota archaeon]|nr:DedA family protein [Candidatus Altiarchaeota archaeon]
MALTEYLAGYITGFIREGGYPMVAFLMALESMIAPVPSEAVMPFAGFLVREGTFTFELVVLASTLGSIAGSLLSYVLGACAGRPFIERFGKYLLLDIHDLELTERFFAKYGEGTIFVSRFIPVIRHLISIPAGAGRMNPAKFTVYTMAGAGIWNAFLAYVGYTLKDNWQEILKYSQVLDIVVIVLLVACAAFFFHKHRKRGKQGV